MSVFSSVLADFFERQARSIAPIGDNSPTDHTHSHSRPTFMRFMLVFRINSPDIFLTDETFKA